MNGPRGSVSCPKGMDMTHKIMCIENEFLRGDNKNGGGGRHSKRVCYGSILIELESNRL